MVSRFAIVAAILILPHVALAQGRESTLILDRAPTVNELIEALTPDSGGIVLETNPQNEALSLEPVKPVPIPDDTDPLGVIVNPPADITVTDVGLRLQFDFDSADLSAAARAELDTFAAAIKSEKLKDNPFVVEGHTDSTGPDSYNQRLSELRAASVRRYLIDVHGIAPGRLRTIGLGESRPLEGQPQDAPTNRRVHFVTAWQGS